MVLRAQAASEFNSAMVFASFCRNKPDPAGGKEENKI
jgi:hypothetical protein